MANEMINHPIAVIIGATFGAIHGVILWVSVESFGFLSSIVYGNQYTLPFLVVGVVDATIIICVATSPWWLPLVMRVRNNFVGEKDEDI